MIRLHLPNRFRLIMTLFSIKQKNVNYSRFSFTYTENADGTISLQDSNGRKATINLWQIDEANNTVALEG